MTAGRGPGSQRRYRIAFAGTALLMLGIIVTLPFSLAGVVDDILGSPAGRAFPLLAGPPATIEPTYSRLHVVVADIDEVQLLATLRVSGYRVCGGPCPGSDRLVLFSLDSDEGEADGLPPSAAIRLAPRSEAVSEVIQLPVRGMPIRYPFDRYHLVLGVALQRVDPDGRVETLDRDQTLRHLGLSIQERLPRKRMSPPSPRDPQRIQTPGSPVTYAAAYAVAFERPWYLRILAVILVLLITAAASYSVFLRPPEDLIVNAGALILGVWGVRAVLVPTNLQFTTAVDLSLSMVILFLLGGLSARVLILAHDRAEMRVLRRPRAGSRDEPRS